MFHKTRDMVPGTGVGHR